jgi:hypothetical protein
MVLRALVVGAALTGSAVVVVSAASAAKTPQPLASSQCVDAVVDGLAGQAGASSANPSLDLRDAKLTVEKNGSATVSLTARGDIVSTPPTLIAPSGAYEVSFYPVDRKQPPAANATLASVLRIDPRDANRPVQIRDANQAAFRKMKAKPTLAANTLTVTLPKHGLAVTTPFAWSISAVSDDPNTATRFEDRCPSQATTPGTIPVQVLAPPTPESQAAVDQAFASAQLAADRAAIMRMWRSLNDAWKVNIDVGVQRAVDLAFPPFRDATSVNFDACRALIGPTVTALNSQITVDPNAINLQPGWVQPTIGQVPQGRIYVMPSSDARTATASGFTASNDRSAEIHAVVGDDGVAYYFPTCKR